MTALVAAGFVAVSQLTATPAAAEVLLEPIGSAGPDPFSDPLAPQPTGSLLAYAEQGAPPAEDQATTVDEEAPTVGEEEAAGSSERDATGEDGPAYMSVDGSVPGLYGGSLDESSCDVDQLVAFLGAEPEKAAAWAQTLKIDVANIPTYIDALTPVHLGADTRVINHGFDGGVATPREAVLQRGTAVLVDARGVPRVNCYCGNPLLPPAASAQESYTGDSWPAFESTDVLVVTEAPSEVGVFELVDVATGSVFSRPAGSRGEADSPPVSRPAEVDRVIDGPIEFDRIYEDRLEDERTEARYTFDAPDSAIMTLTVSNQSTSARRILAELRSQGGRFAHIAIPPGGAEEARIVLDHAGGAAFELVFTEGPAAYEFGVTLEIQQDAGVEGDAGSDFGSGREIGAGQQVEGLLDGADKTDVFVIDVRNGAELRFEAQVARESQRRTLFEVRHEGQRLHHIALQPGASESLSTLLTGASDGIIEVIVTEGPSSYSFSVDFVEQTDGGQPGDSGDTLADARSISTGTQLSGDVGDLDPADWYLFEAPAATTVVQATNDANSTRRIVVAVTDAGGTRVAHFAVAVGASETAEFGSEPGQGYRIEVTEGRAAYTLSVSASGGG